MTRPSPVGQASRLLWLAATGPLAFAVELGPVPQAPLHPPPSLRALAQAAPVAVSLATPNLSSRETSRLFFQTVYAASVAPAPAWTGSFETCDPGTTALDYRDLVALRINYYRAMAGVPAGIGFLDTYSTKAQAAALLMSRNASLSHFPPPDWLCYSDDGADAAGRANLAVGRVGPGAIDSYMEDHGAVNDNVGHRRWLLYPPTREMGTGDIPGSELYPPANATWVLDDHYGDPRPATREEYVAWPPPGYVPYRVVFPRWSFAFPQANFQTTAVTLRSNGVPVAVQVEPVLNGAGENTVVWHLAGAHTATPSPWPRPAADILYEVSLGPVLIGATPRHFSYVVTVFDPAAPGTDTVLPTVQGLDQPPVGVPTSYHFNAVPVASSHEWMAGRRENLTTVEGAESGLGRLVASTSPGYEPVTTNIRDAGTRAFHLAHPLPNFDQTLTWSHPLLCSAASSLRFREYLGIATSAQIGKVEVSLDDGFSWSEVYAHPGGNGTGLVAFRTTTVSLGHFAGRVVRVRFNYHHTGAAHYPQTEPPVGWYLDNVTFLNTEEVRDVQVSSASPTTSFSHIPITAGPQVLAARGRLQDRFALEWGPALPVTAKVMSSPILTFHRPPLVTGGQVQLDFTVSGQAMPAQLRLESATTPKGPWQIEAGAVFSTLPSGTEGRALSLAPAGAARFYRLRSP